MNKNNNFRRRDKITCRVFRINYFPLCAIYATDIRLIFPSLCDNCKLSCQGNIDAFRTCAAFPKLFYICRMGHGYEVDGSTVEKGWRWWLRVVTGDWWKLSDPQLHSGVRRIVLFHQMRLFRACLWNLKPTGVSFDLQPSSLPSFDFFSFSLLRL